MDDDTMLGWVIACVQYDGYRRMNWKTGRFEKIPESELAKGD